MRETVGRHALKGPFSAPILRYLGREFSARDTRKCAIYFEPNRISFSQVYPFYHYEREILDRYGVEIRLIPTERITAGQRRRRPADIVLLQTWLDISRDNLLRILDAVTESNPFAQISFLDSFVNADLRLAKHLDPYITFYIKKSLFRDREQYFSPFKGDTNLTEYYSGIFGLEASPVDWEGQ